MRVLHIQFTLVRVLLDYTLIKKESACSVTWILRNWFCNSGAYDNEVAAAHAYDLAALKYWGQDTILNFPVLNYTLINLCSVVFHITYMYAWCVWINLEQNTLNFCVSIAVIKLSERTERNGGSITGRVYWISEEVKT